jgi:hypothetical protein
MVHVIHVLFLSVSRLYLLQLLFKVCDFVLEGLNSSGVGRSPGWADTEVRSQYEYIPGPVSRPDLDTASWESIINVVVFS